MSDDPTYPTYEIRVRWEQDGEHDPEYPNWHEGLPDGRIHNGTVMHRMEREERDAADMEREIRDEWWPEYVANKLADKNPSDPEVTVTHTGRESWCLSWFEHWTFDVGQTDAEALESFERYVNRYEHMQDHPSAYVGDEGYRCLMGAEDRWRWTGGPGPEDRTDPPCRCEHCQERGVIRIGH